MSVETAEERPKKANGNGGKATGVIKSAESVVLANGRAPEAHPLPVAGYSAGAEYDIVEYIRTCTHQIWDEKFIGKIYDYYHPASIVHTSNGDIYGREQVVRLTTQRQAAFPDTRDFIEDVIWRRNADGSYDTSMRWTYMGTNTGWSVYGPPTGKRVAVRGVANCVIKDNRVVEEWVSYNELSLIRQLGLDPMEVLERFVAAGISNSQSLGDGVGAGLERGAGEVENTVAQDTPLPLDALERAQVSLGDFDVEAFVRRAYHEIWNWRYLGRVDDYFAPNHLCHASSDREIYGRGDYKHDVLTRLAVLPDARMLVDDVYWLEDQGGGYRVAVRWTLSGTHEGFGPYGPPTGRRVRIMGISQHLIQDGRFVEEWTEWGEFALMKRLHSRGASAPSAAPLLRPFTSGTA